MTRPNDDPPRQPMRKVIAASLSGALLEWYDFNLYGLSAALVFNRLFFPDADPLIGTLLSLATFGVGFVSRPIGALLFGHLGDRVGRKQILVATMMIIGGATFLIGLLPDYDTIGVWAPVLLVTLRLVQGLGLGGEFGGASLLTVEHAPRHSRGFWGSLPQTGGPIGYLIAVAVVSLFALLPEDAFLSWGWRVPFLLSAVLLVVGLLVRLKIEETPAFHRVKAAEAQARVPLLTALRRYPRSVVVGFGARLGEAGTSQVYQPFAISFVTTSLGFGQGVALTGVVLYNLLGLALMPVAGAVSDRVGRRPLYLAGGVIVALTAFPYFWLLEMGSAWWAWTAMALAAVGGAVCMSSLQATLFTEMFGVRVRYSGMSFAYQTSAMVAGFVPAAATSLLVAFDGATWPVALLVVGLGAVSVVSTLFMRETRHVDTAELEAASGRDTPGAGG
ncbi:MFS transporter [Streptomonospora nanhaiensis]|uniref:Putative proline/betaine transporter n=1 Tax=Streptomonospora nanhaiensis TaxID=1323731 RepID=A0A853BKF3_9ACTN|nr:MFS transporter [Streptomonospora nanhaiensis]MBV2366678.1 MHS family MFS transporter [Streptomonospora nanhaiensis]MBX9389969.1 MHS family MFS transporter [Streptomonospora nanhaiensis]NYI95979.1 MFS family permease [Streptomonospora nanhaiensis]